MSYRIFLSGMGEGMMDDGYCKQGSLGNYLFLFRIV